MTGGPDIRVIRERLHAISAELDALAPALMAISRRQPREPLSAKSPWTHDTSRDLFVEAVKAEYKLEEARKAVRASEAALSWLDPVRPRLVHLKRIVKRRQRAGNP